MARRQRVLRGRPALQGAGGVVTDWSGKPLTWNVTSASEGQLPAFPGEVLAAGDPRVHQQAQQLLHWKQQ
jgi:inositol-phosphate phosphatase/L-galactose 1-phosphate phosphatase/histidinol-phosphatase